MSVKDTTGYRVTMQGKVYKIERVGNKTRFKEMAQHLNESGYPSVNIRVGGKRKHYAVHVLVCEKFHGPRPDATWLVRHLDGDRFNNHACNLAWGTQKENADDREAHGRTSRGQRHAEAIARSRMSR